jgi:cytochrome c
MRSADNPGEFLRGPDFHRPQAKRLPVPGFPRRQSRWRSTEGRNYMRPGKVMNIALLVIIGSQAWPPLALAEGDTARGKTAFRKTCAVCHGDATAAQGPGPSLAGLFGRRAGTVNGTPYGKNLYEANIIWNDASLQRYLASPADAVHGTIMPIGVNDPMERSDIIAYLKTLTKH